MSQPGPTPTAPAAGPATGSPETELWQLLGRADVIMRALIEAPDRAARQRGQERARLWLRDVGQAWVHAPAPPPPDGGQRS